MADRVCQQVNSQIKNPRHHFHFNNHRTASEDTLHPEQRKSATFFALEQHEIPAFGIETSQNIPAYKQRVRYQTMVINAFMEAFGIIPENPRLVLDDPLMKYLIVSVSGSNPVVIYNHEKLSITKGDTIKIVHLETNYERGLTADILGVGSLNDYRKPLSIFKETKVIVKKDNYRCGEISIGFERPVRQARVFQGEPQAKYLIYADK